MKKAPIPSNEKRRLAAVHSLDILDSASEERFDILTREVTSKLNVPISTITIMDEDREWYKSHQGLDIDEGSRDISFCGHAMLDQNVFVIEDTLLDERFHDNPNVVNDPKIRFYAGVALHEKSTHLPVGVFCIKDIKPRELSLGEIDVIMEYAKKAEQEINR